MIRYALFISIAFYSYAASSQEFINPIQTGAERMDKYLPLIKGKRIGLTVNHTSMVGETHLIDTLKTLKQVIAAVFSPEHGFRGKADAGESVNNEQLQGFQVYSLYGSSKKPSLAQLKGIDLMIFDMQDVGARFYTYISTLHYVMEACAEQNIPIIVLDRPNPNGSYVDGPVLDTAYRSFVGIHPIPVVHGLTIGELATMINGEGWLKNSIQATLTVIPIANWDHRKKYELPVPPSPNLPNQAAITMYPSLCFFEGTIMSIGRGTDWAFQCYGHPDYKLGTFTFTPKTRIGAKSPPHENQLCSGFLIDKTEARYGLNLQYLIDAYTYFNSKNIEFFNNYFNTLAGNAQLQAQIKSGLSASQIRASWQSGLNQYKKIRAKYLIYP
jgi:uncharacterized protein YbbC (DUF1343 family)